jgi:hypothetical protein
LVAVFIFAGLPCRPAWVDIWLHGLVCFRSNVLETLALAAVAEYCKGDTFRDESTVLAASCQLRARAACRHSASVRLLAYEAMANVWWMYVLRMDTHRAATQQEPRRSQECCGHTHAKNPQKLHPLLAKGRQVHRGDTSEVRVCALADCRMLA